MKASINEMFDDFVWGSHQPKCQMEHAELMRISNYLPRGDNLACPPPNPQVIYTNPERIILFLS